MERIQQSIPIEFDHYYIVILLRVLNIQASTICYKIVYLIHIEVICFSFIRWANQLNVFVSTYGYTCPKRLNDKYNRPIRPKSTLFKGSWLKKLG